MQPSGFTRQLLPDGNLEPLTIQSTKFVWRLNLIRSIFLLLLGTVALATSAMALDIGAGSAAGVAGSSSVGSSAANVGSTSVSALAGVTSGGANAAHSTKGTATGAAIGTPFGVVTGSTQSTKAKGNVASGSQSLGLAGTIATGNATGGANSAGTGIGSFQNSFIHFNF